MENNAEKRVLCQIEDGVALLTLNRPDALNALNAALLAELDMALTDLEENEEVGALVITGAGDRAFVAGADIKEMADLSVAEAKEFSLRGQRVFEKIETLRKPVIAAVNGHALGGGCELAMSCDIRIASSKASFGQPELNLGVIPGFGGTQRLPRLIGKGPGMYMLLTCCRIKADEALRLGLVSEVVEPDALASRAQELARQIASYPASTINACKQAVNRGLSATQAEGCAAEADLFALCFTDGEQARRMKAFANK